MRENLLRAPECKRCQLRLGQLQSQIVGELHFREVYLYKFTFALLLPVCCTSLWAIAVDKVQGDFDC